MLVNVEDGRATKLRGNPDHPITRGFLCAKVAGYLRQITVDAGSRVSEGQLIATLEVPEFEADLAQNSADLSRIESDPRVFDDKADTTDAPRLGHQADF